MARLDIQRIDEVFIRIDSEPVIQAELAGVLGVSPQRASVLRRRPGFPKPALQTVGGHPIWLAADVREWNARRRPGRPRQQVE